jgi:uncharacterized protein (TIGR03437 family)
MMTRIFAALLLCAAAEGTALAQTITAVQDAGSYTANVAQGGLFVVKGSGLSGNGFTEATAPYQQTLAGVGVTFTPITGGAGTQAYIIYAYNENGVNQIAGLVPSTLAVGAYNVTVTYNSTTGAPFQAQVVAAKPALLTQDSSGSGLALVQNYVSASEYDINRLTTGTVSGSTISPAQPGQTLIAWGTGLGAVPFPDNSPPANGYNYPGVQVVVGGTIITPAYAGPSAYPGLDQINFTLPNNVSTGCSVSLQIVVGSTPSAVTSVSIAPSGSNACVYPGLTTQQLQQLDQGGTYTVGSFDIDQFSESLAGLGNFSFSDVGGSFTQITGFQLSTLSSSAAYAAAISTIGACTVISTTVSSSSSGSSGSTGTAVQLDAGTITLNGPSGSNIANAPLTDTSNLYSLTIGQSGIPGGVSNGSIVAGTYTLTGTGGKNVGPFTVSLNLGSPLTITGGLPSTVTESAGLTLNWTGGNSSDVVVISGYSGSTTGTGANQVTNATEFVCTTTAGKGTFTVPSSVLTQLPKVASTSLTSGTGTGFLEVESGPSPTSFSPSLTAGGTAPSYFGAFVGSAGTVAYQ